VVGLRRGGLTAGGKQCAGERAEEQQQARKRAKRAPGQGCWHPRTQRNSRLFPYLLTGANLRAQIFRPAAKRVEGCFAAGLSRYCPIRRSPRRVFAGKG